MTITDLGPGTPPNDDSTVIGGVLIAWACNFLHFASMFFLSGIGDAKIVNFIFFAYPMLQYVYIVPLVMAARREGLHDRVKGLIVGSSITLLISGTCFAQLYRSFR